TRAPPLPDTTLFRSVSIIEVQVSEDLSRAFFIFESAERGVLNDSLRKAGIPVILSKPVRWVGQELDAVRAQPGKVNYLVEWKLRSEEHTSQLQSRES